MREFINGGIHIDGRKIPYKLVTADDYFEAQGFSESEIVLFWDRGIGELVNQIMGLKQSCYLLRHTSHSDGSLSDNLYTLKLRLIEELKEKYSFEFEDDFVEKYGF